MTQEHALNIMKAGHNVFLTGSAGSGKTYTLNQYIDWLRSHDIRVAVTASTGIAATHIGGTTIHSWSGIGIKNSLNEKEIDALTQKEYLARHFDDTQILIIDEISMLDARRLDLVNRVCQAFKRDDRPFGGMQIILCGDFFQLPPIDRDANFAFAAAAWADADIKVCYLEEQHRHQGDSEFFTLLNAVRNNAIEDTHMNILRLRSEESPHEVLEPTRLYTHNANVDAMNDEKLAKLPGEIHECAMMTKGRANLVESLKKSCLAPETLRLKDGALVMFVKNNYEQGFVNGTMGRVIGFEDGVPLIETFDGKQILPNQTTWAIEEDGKTLAELSQLPLRLAWAITIHKSQGMSLDAAEIDLSRAFVPGQGYVALSRVRTLKGLYIKGFNDVALQVHPEILNTDQKLKDHSAQSHEYAQTMTPEEHQELHDAFILAAGGSLKKIDYVAKAAVGKKSTHEQTLDLLNQKLSIADIAKERDLKRQTIISHIEKLREDGHDFELQEDPPTGFNSMQKAFDELGPSPLKPVFEKLQGKYSYDDLRLGRLFWKKK